MRKNLISRGLVVMLIIAILSACIPSFASAEGTKLELWLLKTWADSANEQVEQRVLKFIEETGIDVEYSFINSGDQQAMFSACMQSGNWPDVFYVGSMYYSTLQDADVLLNIDDVIADVEATNGPFISDFIEPFRANGNLAMPFFSDCKVMFYRTDILEECGFSEPPKTYDELYTYCEAIKEKTGLYGYGTAIAPGCEDFNQDAHSWLWSFGGAEVAEDGKTVAINSPETRKMMEYIIDMYNKGYIPESALTWDDSGNNTSYLTGQCAMITNAASIWEAVKKEGLEDLRAATAMCPNPIGDKGRIVCGSVIWLTAAKNTEHPEEAKALLKYLVDDEWYSNWIETLAPVEGPVFQKYGESEYWSQYPGSISFEAINNYQFLGYPGKVSPLGNLIYNANLIANAFHRVLVDGYTVDDAIVEWESEIQKIVDEYYAGR